MFSKPLEDLEAEYDVVVIGTGYGGGVSASRLSRAGYSVCVLERGREFIAGDFPDTLGEAMREAQYQTDLGHIGSNTGLFDIRFYDDMSIVQGCGLGGTSLINANVSLRLDPRVFEDPQWPPELIADMDRLESCYQLAESMLAANPLPERHEGLKKYQAHKQSSVSVQADAQFAHAKFYKPPINVTFDNKLNHAGVEQRACILCGDCVAGCNHTAKNTTAMNYLPDAYNHGAEIFCESEVKFIALADDGRWHVHFHSAHLGRDVFDPPTRFITANKVIVSAGTLGSTEIMLRSKQKGLALSDQVGKGFSGNGDILAFGYNNDQEINGVGSGDRDPQDSGVVGPCITSIIDCRDSAELADGFVLEEGSLPGALGAILPGAFSTAARAFGEDTDSGIGDYLMEKSRELYSMVRGPYKGAVDNTQTYLVMSHDGADGQMLLDDDKLKIAWPGIGDRPRLPMYARAMTLATKALGGTFLKNPLTNEWNNNNQVTVHPLGGCCMGASADDGVVNHKGQVFSSGSEVHQGLYITDGSVLPRSVGVNPLLTISAISERMCQYLVQEDKGIGIPLDVADETLLGEPRNQAVGIRFTEKMAGHYTPGDLDYQAACDQGKVRGNDGAFEFVLTIISRDVDQMLNTPEHQASMFGTVVAPALSPKPLTASNGSFQLFVQDPEDAKIFYMRYNMSLHAEDGRQYRFEGHKLIHDDTGFDIWADTTTLYISVHDDDQLVGRGMLFIDPRDFLKQITTVKGFNGGNFIDNTAATARFARFFTEKLLVAY